VERCIKIHHRKNTLAPTHASSRSSANQDVLKQVETAKKRTNRVSFQENPSSNSLSVVFLLFLANQSPPPEFLAKLQVPKPVERSSANRISQLLAPCHQPEPVCL
jgi:hypothetical protein